MDGGRGVSTPVAVGTTEVSALASWAEPGFAQQQQQQGPSANGPPTCCSYPPNWHGHLACCLHLHGSTRSRYLKAGCTDCCWQRKRAAGVRVPLVHRPAAALLAHDYLLCLCCIAVLQTAHHAGDRYCEC